MDSTNKGTFNPMKEFTLKQLSLTIATIVLVIALIIALNLVQNQGMPTNGHMHSAAWQHAAGEDE